MSKADLRKRFTEIRSYIETPEEQSDAIYSLLVCSDLYKNSGTVLAYWSVGSEVSTHRIIDRALRDGKQVALPRCTDKKGNMEFYYISSLNDLCDGMYGIKEPSGDIKADCLDENAICLVPGLSFDINGYRLGYGKGYYDRFLSGFCGVSIGLCFNDCLSEELPVGEYDIKVDYIITNTKIYDLR